MRLVRFTMRRAIMRQLLPLAVVCLLAVQLAAGARSVSSVVKRRQVPPCPATPVPTQLTDQKFVQVGCLQAA